MAAPRSVWSGTIVWGIVSVPVKLYSATSDQGVKFNQINSKTGARIRQKRVDDVTGDEVAYEDIVKGFQYTPDRYVVVDDNELEALAPGRDEQGKRIKTIALSQFAKPSEIDPLAYDTPYFVGPDTGGEHSYGLLAQAMRKTGRIGIGRVVLRTKERLVALFALPNGTIACATMRFADELRPGDVGVKPFEPAENEFAMAVQLIEGLTAPFDHETHRDNYRDSVMALIEAKVAGEPTPTPQLEAGEPAVDLMAALQQSLETVRGRQEVPVSAEVSTSSGVC